MIAVRVPAARLTGVAVRIEVRRPAAATVATALALLPGWAVWQVYKPCIANYDGLWIYAQANTGVCDDWQPVALPFLLSIVLKIGVGMTQLTLVQSLLVCLGVQRLAAAVAGRTGLSNRAAHAAGLGTLLLLLTPLTPLAYYLCYFGSDGFLPAPFLWFATLFLKAWDSRISNAVALTLLAAGITLGRPNAAVLAPVFAALLFALLGRKRWRTAALCALAVFAARPAVYAVVDAAVDVKRTHPEDQVMALDLVGLALMKPDALADLPLTAASLDGDRHTREYAWGAVEPLYPWIHAPIVKPGFARDNHAALLAEYKSAAAQYPFTLVLVKLRAFAAHLLEPNPYWHNSRIDPNDFGFQPHYARKPVRDFHDHLDKLVVTSPVLSWVSARHVLWLGLNAAAVLALAYRAWKFRDRRSAGLCLVLLLPLAYSLSFALAVTTNHFRFLYPSTLVVQAAAGGLFFARIKSRLDAPPAAP